MSDRKVKAAPPPLTPAAREAKARALLQRARKAGEERDRERKAKP